MITYRLLLICLFALPILGQADCNGAGIIIDQRSKAQTLTDEEQGRKRCVVFVLAATDQAAGYGWVAWHHVSACQSTSTHRLGLFPIHGSQAMAFGRVPDNLETPDGALTVTVLLPSHRWWLVNTTRHGWQLRSGTVSDPGMDTLRKLFTDVAINAGMIEQAQGFERWWPGSSRE